MDQAKLAKRVPMNLPIFETCNLDNFNVIPVFAFLHLCIFIHTQIITFILLESPSN